MKKCFYVLLFISVVIVISCGKSKNNENETSESGTIVCIWENTPLRETPENNGKWIASISLGEKSEYLDEEKEVANGDKTLKFIKIKLQDGKEGWVQSDFVVLNSQPAAIINDAEMYSRPDLLTKTGKAFSKMDIIGLKTEQNGFVEVVGKRKNGKWIESGWIKPTNISTSDIDIAVSKYAGKALAIKDIDEQQKAINEIINNSDFAGSIFIDDLKKLLIPENPTEPEAIIEESEAIEEAVDETVE
ncbi:MAG: SH3 domain-containing protein [Bacteroidales bacterium]